MRARRPISYKRWSRLRNSRSFREDSRSNSESMAMLWEGRAICWGRASGGETFARFLPHTPSSNALIFPPPVAAISMCGPGCRSVTRTAPSVFWKGFLPHRAAAALRAISAAWAGRSVLPTEDTRPPLTQISRTDTQRTDRTTSHVAQGHLQPRSLPPTASTCPVRDAACPPFRAVESLVWPLRHTCRRACRSADIENLPVGADNAGGGRQRRENLHIALAGEIRQRIRNSPRGN